MYRQDVAGIEIIKKLEEEHCFEFPEIPFKKIISQLESYNLEEEERLKISFGIIENARDIFFEEINSRKSYYKKELKKWKLQNKI